MSTATLITADEFARMSFGVPVELIEGEIVEMTIPGGRHGETCFVTAAKLAMWILGGAAFRVTTNDAGVVTHRNPDSVRGPDLSVTRRDRLPGGKMPIGPLAIPPDLVIEIRSPSDRWPDVIEKVSQFLHAGVLEVWVIDPEIGHVHVFRANDEPTILNRDDILQSPELPGFHCRVAELFEELNSGSSS